MGHFGQPDDVEHLVDPGAGDVVRRGEEAQMVVGTARRVERLGVEEGADLTQRPRSSAYGCPLTSAEPEVGLSSPMIMRMVVDLPEPFGPRNPVTTPG